MPTNRTRHSVTETDEVTSALDAAARRWPQDAHSRSRLLLRLIDLGWTTVRLEQAGQDRAHRDAVDATAGALTGAYPADYLDTLRGDWPA
jgi:hypothetical protein